MKNYITLIALTLSFASCTKMIDIDYENIDPLYVVEASFSNENSYLLLTQTTEMDQPLQTDPITTATISVSDSDGYSEKLEYQDLGLYAPTNPQIDFVEGNDYTLTIEVEEEIFTSTVHLHPTPVIADVSFSAQQFSSDMNLIFCTFKIQDTPGEDNYYRYRFCYFGNDGIKEGEDDESNEEEEEEVEIEKPNWSLTKQIEDGGEIELMTHLYSSDRDLEDGDIITIEVQSIDRSVYNYFYTLSLSGNSSTNPTSNFDGGCLGYFSLYSFTSVEAVFYYSDL